MKIRALARKMYGYREVTCYTEKLRGSWMVVPCGEELHTNGRIYYYYDPQFLFPDFGRSTDYDIRFGYKYLQYRVNSGQRCHRDGCTEFARQRVQYNPVRNQWSIKPFTFLCDACVDELPLKGDHTAVKCAAKQ